VVLWGGNTWARFRLDTTDTNTVTGAGVNGEVEDYLVGVESPDIRVDPTMAG